MSPGIQKNCDRSCCSDRDTFDNSFGSCCTFFDNFWCHSVPDLMVQKKKSVDTG